VKRGQTPNQNAAYWIAVAVDFFQNIVYIKSIQLWQAAFAEGEPPLL
jgi:hypothetical protein